MALLLIPSPVASIGVAARRRILGVAFIAICVGLLTLAVGAYNKWFTPVVPVTLEANAAGNQLDVPADVKLNGVIVGEVRSVRSDGRTATISLALNPSDVHLIPANVVARILPKTLFGEKFVDLVVPSRPSPQHLAAHAVIPEDRSATAIELQHVFDDVLPVLRTLKPAELNEALSAIATALQDRGAALGDNLVRADRYFQAFNPHLPAFEADISGIADLAANLNSAAPDLLATLRNFAANARTVVAKQSQIADVLRSTTGFADTTTAVLQQNANRLIELNAVSRPVLDVISQYSVEFPCLANGLTQAEKRLEPVFGPGPYLHIQLIAVQDPGAYQPGVDKPDYAKWAGTPGCHGLPDSGPVDPSHSGAGGVTSRSAYQLPSGGATEKQLVSSIVAPNLGRPATEVSDLADLLVGPMIRGMAVAVQ